MGEMLEMAGLAKSNGTEQESKNNENKCTGAKLSYHDSPLSQVVCDYLFCYQSTTALLSLREFIG
jgi:hypothetical protein